MFCSRGYTQYTHENSSLFCSLYLTLTFPLSLQLKHIFRNDDMSDFCLRNVLFNRTAISIFISVFPSISVSIFTDKWKSFPTAGIEPRSFQSKRVHAIHSAMMNPQEREEKTLFSLCKIRFVVKTQNLLQKECRPAYCLDRPTSSLEKNSRHSFSFLFAFSKLKRKLMSTVLFTWKWVVSSVSEVVLSFCWRFLAFRPRNVQFNHPMQWLTCQVLNQQ